MTAITMTLESPVYFKTVGEACGAEEAAIAKWVKLATFTAMAGVTSAMLADEKGETYKKVRTLVVQAQKPNIITLLTASSAIGFTEQERSDRTHWKNRVDGVYMKRIREHLRKIEETERGASDRKTFGETLAKDCQEMVDRIRRAKEDKIDFDAPEAIVALKACKEIFLS